MGVNFLRKLMAVALGAALIPSYAHAQPEVTTFTPTNRAEVGHQGSERVVLGDNLVEVGGVNHRRKEVDCTPIEVSKEGWTLMRCVDADGTEFYSWKGHLACGAVGLGVSLVFTPMWGVLSSVACKLLATPSPAYDQFDGPYADAGAYGTWDDDDSAESGDFYYDEYYYDPAEDVYYIEVTSHDYPNSQSGGYHLGPDDACTDYHSDCPTCVPERCPDCGIGV